MDQKEQQLGEQPKFVTDKLPFRKKISQINLALSPLHTARSLSKTSGLVSNRPKRPTRGDLDNQAMKTVSEPERTVNNNVPIVTVSITPKNCQPDSKYPLIPDNIMENKILKFVENLNLIESTMTLKNFFTKNLQPIPSSDAKFDSFRNPLNLTKNRNQNLWCIESSRVKLKPVPGGSELTSDYIHANHIRIEKLKKSYITTQEPLPNTLDSFWRMIYGEEVTMILSFAPLVGTKFWPDKKDEYRSVGEFFVTCKRVLRSKSSHSPLKYVLEVLPDGCSQSVITELFHYSQWSKTGIPTSPKALSSLIKCAKLKTSSPIVVQCETGTNQSAAFVFADIIITTLYDNNNVELEPLFRQIRKQKIFFLSQRLQFLYVIYALLLIIRIKLTKKKILLPEMLKTISSLETSLENELYRAVGSTTLLSKSPPSPPSELKWELS